MEETDDNKQEKKVTKIIQSKKEFIRTPAPVNVFPYILQNDKANNNSGMVTINEKPKILSEGKIKENFGQTKQKSQVNEYVFDKPNPWSKIIIYDNKEYNYHFYIKIHIPSLNAYENWKQIIPNLNFNATTRELIIPSKDEQSALALINLIYMNFMGQISLTNILEKNLIQISINKCKAYKVIENKIRDQINDNLNGNVNAKINVLYEKDLSSIQNSDQKNSKKINFLNMDTNNELNNRRLDNQELNNSSKFFNSYSDSTVEAVEASRDSLNIFKSLETDPQPYDGSYFSYI